jgi:hypothetical protein
MQAEANQQTNPQAAAEPKASWMRTFVIVAVITVVILGALGAGVMWLGGNEGLPMNYPGFDGQK